MLWLLPAAAPAAAEAAVAATAAIGSAAYIGADVLGFRRGGLPPVTGRAPGEVTQKEAIAEMVRGALVPNSQTGNIFPKPPPLNELLLLPALAQVGKWIADRLDIGKALGQIWGLLGGNKQETAALVPADMNTWPVNPGGQMWYWWSRYNHLGEYDGLSAWTIGKPFFRGEEGLPLPKGVWVYTSLYGGGVNAMYGRSDDTFRLNDYGPYGTGTPTQPTVSTGSGFFPTKSVPVASPQQPVQPTPPPEQQQPAQAPAGSAAVTQPAPAGAPAAQKPYPLIQTPSQAAAIQQIVKSYQLPSATRVTGAGTLPAAQPATAAQTSTTTRTYGPVTVTTTAPRATLEGIAEEVGRLEKKLGEILNPKTDNQPDWLEKLQGLWDLINALNNYMQAQGASGTYTASSPCVTDQQGNRITTEIDYQGAGDQFGILRNRIDALAELMQAFKDLRQPICKGAPASNVTVTAYEVVQE